MFINGYDGELILSVLNFFFLSYLSWNRSSTKLWDSEQFITGAKKPHLLNNVFVSGSRIYFWSGTDSGFYVQQVTGTVLYGYFFVYSCVRPVILVPVLPHYAVLWIRNDFFWIRIRLWIFIFPYPDLPMLFKHICNCWKKNLITG